MLASRPNARFLWTHDRLSARRVNASGWVFVLAAAFMVLASLATAQDATDDVTDGAMDWSVEVPILVDELDAGDARTRREAQQKLIDAGPQAAKFVPAVTDHLSIEARQRLQQIKFQWKSERTRAESAAVTVRFGDAKTVEQALEAISAVSGVEFELPQIGDPAAWRSKRIDVPATPMGFWHAVDWVLDAAKLDINFYGGDRRTLQLVPRAENRRSRVDSAAYSGIYRIEPTVITARRVLGAPELSGLNVTMTIAWQPGRQPIGLSIPVGDISAKLDDGVLLRPQSTADTIDIATSSELSQSEFYLPMQLPDGSPTKITQLSGTIEALLPGEAAAFELMLSEPAAMQTIDAMTVTLENVRANGPLHELRVGVELDSADRSLESHRQWIFENDAYVVLDDGTRLDHLGFETFRQTTSGIGIGYLFDLGGLAVPTGAKLVYESPTSVIPSEVAMVIEGIRLP